MARRCDVLLVYRLLLALGYKYVTVRKAARILGISRHKAGRVLAEMERMGLARKWGKRTYIILGGRGDH